MTTGGAGDLAAAGGSGTAALPGTSSASGAARLTWPQRPMLFTGSPEGAGILAAQRGDDPFAVTTQIRTLWR